MDTLFLLWEIHQKEHHKLLITVWLIAMACDVLLGILASIKQRRLSSNIASNGIIRKLASFVFVMLFGLIVKALELDVFYPVLVFGMILSEVQSIVELLYVLEIPFVASWIKMVANESIIKKLEGYGISLEMEEKERNQNPNKESNS
jgi:toxin secretion/phage lysis holin